LTGGRRAGTLLIRNENYS